MKEEVMLCNCQSIEKDESERGVDADDLERELGKSWGNVELLK